MVFIFGGCSGNNSTNTGVQSNNTGVQSNDTGVQSNDTTTITISTAIPFEYTIASKNHSNIYTLIDAPVGMRILPSGIVRWTPTPAQIGVYKVNINHGQDTVKRLILHVVAGSALSDGYFFNPALPHNRYATGTEDDPFTTMQDACKVVAAGDTIYIRGGTYKPTDFLDGNKSKGAFIRIDGCQGKEGMPITLRPWGNEWVTIQGDGFSVIKISNSTHVYVMGLEVEGIASYITPEEAAANWWKGEKYYNGGGIAIGSSKKGPTHDIVVAECIVHDVPASGIKSYGATHIRIMRNIVYHTNWWTIQGTNAVGIVLADKLKNDLPDKTYNEISGNLLFGTEQRIYSRVWAKSAAKFVIDEGEAVLVQEGMRSMKDRNGAQRTGYDGRYLIADNTVVYNGKGVVVNLADKVDIRNNTLKDNGTTGRSPFTGLKGGGFAFNETNDTTLIYNVVDTAFDGIPFWKSNHAEHPVKHDNHMKGHFFLQRATYDYSGIVQYDESTTLVKDNVFESVIEGVGARTVLLKKAKVFGITPAPTYYVTDYSKLTQQIIDAMDPDIKISDINRSDKKYIQVHLIMPKEHPHTIQTGTPYYTLEIPIPYAEGVHFPK